jgi:steroid 5-alpha reductase family enzyme
MTRPIQIIFSCIALAMLALFVYRVMGGDWTALNWGMLAVAATACLLVFVRFMQIFSYGYALSAIGNGLLIVTLRPSVAAGLLAAVAILYGIRMSVFIWRRNQSASFAPQVAEGNARDQAMPMGVKVMLWHLCTWLFAYHLMAVYFVAERGELTTGVLIGALVMLAGVTLEGLADAQKQRVKQRDASALVTEGLYRRRGAAWPHGGRLKRGCELAGAGDGQPRARLPDHPDAAGDAAAGRGAARTLRGTCRVSGVARGDRGAAAVVMEKSGSETDFLAISEKICLRPRFLVSILTF